MIRCLLVDDEPIALRILQTHLAHIPDAQVVAACTSAVEALGVVQQQPVDLVFLDIEMPGLTGIGFVQSLVHPPRFIFTTAHRMYALEGFELDAVDFLLKPIALPRLLRAVEKYRQLQPAPSEAAPAEAASESPPPALHLRVDRRTVRVDVHAIRYVESLGDYVRFHTDTGAPMTKGRLRDFADELAPYGFVRIHRSFLVALRHVAAFTARDLQVAGQTLPISRTYRREVLDQLDHMDSAS